MYESAFGITLALHRVILGTWDASTNIPDVTALPFQVRDGQKYRVAVTGTVDIGNGLQTYNAGDYIAYFESLGWIKDDHTPKASETSNDSTVAGASVADALESVQAEVDAVEGDIADHLADLANPHDTGIPNLLSGTIVQLNALITDLIATYGGIRDIGIGAIANRPVASIPNRFWWSTDNQSLYRDTGVTWVGINAVPIMVANTNVIFVSKIGNDADEGLTINTPKLSIASAVAKATALLPTSSNFIDIVILDAGVYTESFAMPDYVNLDGEGATVVGNITLSSVSHIDIGRLQGNATYNGAGKTYITTDLMTGHLTNGSTGNLISEIGTHENPSGICASNLGTGTLYLTSDELIAGTAGVVVANGEVNMDIAHIKESSASIAIDVNGGKVKGSVESIVATTAYDIESGAEVHLFITSSVGIELNDGTLRLMKASDSQYFLDATATTRGLMGIIAQTFAGLKTFNTPIRMPTLNSDNLLKGSSPNGDVANSGIVANSIAEEGSFLNMQPFTSAPVLPTNGDFWFRKNGAQCFLEYRDGGVTYSVELGSI